jgi:hypothetical protein
MQLRNRNLNFVFVILPTNPLVIAPASATVVLSDLSPTYDGTAKAVSVGTTPSGVAMAVTYNGLTNPPTNASSYTVVALSADGNWVGGATNTLVISKAPVMGVVNSSLNPSGYRDDVTFTASITDGTGTVQFLTNGSNFGYAIYIVGNSANTNLNTLPRGTNVVIGTAEFLLPCPGVAITFATIPRPTTARPLVFNKTQTKNLHEN